MSARQPTAGPWRIGDAGLTVFGPPNGNPSPETVARCLTRENASLVAAAPEMLDLLGRLLTRLEREGIENVDTANAREIIGRVAS